MNSLQLPRPPVNSGRQTSQYPSKVTVDAQVVFQILSHALRKPQEDQRVLGTLVGVRSDDGNTVHVKSAYIVPISEVNDEVKFDVDYHVEMFSLVRKAYPESAIVGWYSTSPTIDNLSGLIHDLYSQEHGTHPYPALHLTVQTTAAADIDLKTYITSAIGAQGESSLGSHIFLPVANEVVFTDVDLSTMQLVNQAATTNARVADVLSVSTNIDDTIKELEQNLEKVQKYVKAVIAGKSQANQAVGKYLFETLSMAPVVAQGSSKDVYEAYLKDLTTVTELAGAVHSQVELNSDLTNLA